MDRGGPTPVPRPAVLPGSCRDDPHHRVRQRALKLQCDLSGSRESGAPLLRGREQHRHGLRADRADGSVRLAGTVRRTAGTFFSPRSGFSAFVPRTSPHGRQMPANANNGRALVWEDPRHRWEVAAAVGCHIEGRPDLGLRGDEAVEIAHPTLIAAAIRPACPMRAICEWCDAC